VLLAALPYFIAMASDLRYAGYKGSDVFRIYGFNLILLPVNLAGVLKSIQQSLTGKKIPFVRTPKVKNRTASPLLYVVTPFLIVAFSLFTLWRDVNAQNWGNAAFAAFNATLAIWAIISYIGVGNAIVDMWLGATRPLYVDKGRRQKAEEAHPETASIDWRSVLYHGHAGGQVPRAHGLTGAAASVGETAASAVSSSASASASDASVSGQSAESERQAA